MSRATVRTPSVEFARKGSAASADGDIVRRRGVIFRAGSYPEKSFAMTAAELRQLAETFTPVPVDLGHPSSSSPLDGTMGDLEAVELSDDGSTLYGRVAFPRWLEDRLGDAKRLVSATFDRATKRLRSLSLVTRPQIEDAELLAAFCACQGGANPTTTTEETAMTKKEQLKAYLDGLGDGDDVDDGEASLILFPNARAEAENTDETDEAEPEPKAAFSADPEIAAIQARLIAAERKNAATEAQLAAVQGEAAKKDALAWAKEEVESGRSAAVEFSSCVEAYLDAFNDDARYRKTVEFTQEGTKKTGSRVDALKARHAARPARFFHERLPVNDEETTTFAVGGKAESDEEYAARVNGKHLARRKIGANGHG